jgi:hypothetical protein
VEGGDSGGPVFTLLPDGESVALAGIMVLRWDNEGGFFRSGLSLWRYVEFEVGDPLGGWSFIYGSQ